ncbi:hypothetical protein ACHRVK_14365 [Flavobacterium plurextorum]|uniref:hypothetical protein n=1 Tax=Flavobacterium plurextorum TaxID=1114867 RepID=UPI003756A2EF
MRLSDNQKNSIIIFIIGLGLTISLFYYFLEVKNRTILNFLSLFGTFTSLYGLWLAYEQILSLKKSSEETKNAVIDSLKKIDQILSVSELSKANKIIQEIQTSNSNSKHELSLLRMRDLKNILIQIKYNKDLNSYTETGLYIQNIADLSIDINNLNDLIIGKKKGINSSKLNSNLEHLATTLSEFENKLKFERNDI